MIQVKCDVQTRKAIPNSNLLGFETDNESNSIYFRVNPHISGTAEVYIERDQDTGYIVLDEASDSYYLPIKKSLVKQKGTVIMQLIITTSDEKVYTFDKITFEVKTSIKVDEEIPDEYPTWMEVGNARLAEFNEAIEETNVAIQEINEAIDDANQAIDDMNEVKDQILEDKEAGLFDGFSPIATVTETQSGATISITDVNGTTTADVLNGEKGDKGDTGASAKINGVNTLTIEAGDNVTLNQEDNTLTISATDTTDYTELTNKPSVNNVELNGNKSLADLGIKQSYTKSDVGLNNVDNIRQYSADNPPPYPVTSVNSLTGNVIIDTHDDLIPTQASSSNQLADKNFVNSSIATSTATFKGTYDSLAELEAVTADDNDYGFVVSVDSSGNTVYNRYKYSNDTWVFEYALNNSSFTAAQWDAIQSGITSDLVTKLQGIEEGAEVNVIEGVEIANTLQSITGKIVKIEPDTTPIEDSTNVINSNAVYEIENMLPLGSTTCDIDNAQPYKILNVVADGKYQQESTTGKQLFDKTTITDGRKNKRVSTSTGGSYSVTGYAITPLIPINSNTQYTLSSGILSYYCWYDENSTYIGGDSWQDKSAKTAPANAKYVRFDFKIEDIDAVMLEQGSTATDYEPYTGGIPSPNPDYPQPITQVTSMTWNRAGKNLFNKTTVIDGKRLGSDGMPYGDNNYCLTDFINVSPSTSYTYSRSTTGGSLACYCLYDNEKNFISRGWWGNNTTDLSLTLTTSNNARYIRITDLQTLKDNMQLEKGSTSTTYSPYQGQSIPIDLDGNEVCSVGTIKDKVLVDRYGNVALQKNVGKVVLNGSESGWYVNTGANSKYRYALEITNAKRIDTHEKGLLLSDKYVNKTSSETYSNIQGISSYSTNANVGGIYIYDDTYNTNSIQPFKTWLSTHNVTVYYALATPTIIPLPKLSTLPTTLKGINHIWVDTNLGRTAIEVEYVKDLSLDIPTKTSELTNDANFVKNTDYATNSTGGVFKSSTKFSTGMGTGENDGLLLCAVKTYNDYLNLSNYSFVGKGTLENWYVGKEIVNKTYVDTLVGDIETALTTLDVGGGVQ